MVGTRLHQGTLDPQLETADSVFQIKRPDANGAKLGLEEALKITCLAMEPNAIPKRVARNSARNSVYSIKIKADAKKEIRDKLESIFGYTHSVIYPDLPGFVQYGVRKVLKGK